MARLAAPGQRRRATALPAALALLVVATAWTFWPVGGYPFIGWDDGGYVTDNPMVRGGLTAAGVRLAFTTFQQANWHPLTWLSHMLDVSLFGLDAGAHHRVNLALHLVAAALLLAVLRAATGKLWRSFAVSLLFAVHPLHVESVAWVSERKDVLAAVFWALTLAAYVGYARRPGTARYAALLGAYLLGLMAKPTLVALPLVLLLLDFWPLGRLGPPGAGSARAAARRLLVEKLPLLAAALASAAVTLAAQSGASRAVVPLEVVPAGLRLANAAVSAATYLAQALVPRRMAFFYPFPLDGVPVAELGGSILLLTALGALALGLRRRAPWLAAGWGWYLVSLLPVIGIVQAGLQARADRYTYLPLVGAFLAVVWSAAGAAVRTPRRRLAAVAAGTVAALACVVVSRAQVAHWRDTEALMRHALDVSPRNWVARVNLGAHLRSTGREAQGLAEYRQAAEDVPLRAQRHFRRGVELAGRGQLREAAEAFRVAAATYPPYAAANFRLGLAQVALGEPERAVEAFRAAIAFRPDFAEAHFQRGVTLAALGQWEEAAANLAEALRLRPGDAAARYNLETVLMGLGYGPREREAYLATPGSGPAAAPPTPH